MLSLLSFIFLFSARAAVSATYTRAFRTAPALLGAVQQTASGYCVSKTDRLHSVCVHLLMRNENKKKSNKKCSTIDSMFIAFWCSLRMRNRYVDFLVIDTQISRRPRTHKLPRFSNVNAFRSNFSWCDKDCPKGGRQNSEME